LWRLLGFLLESIKQNHQIALIETAEDTIDIATICLLYSFFGILLNFSAKITN
jgi:hypothetical protein